MSLPPVEWGQKASPLGVRSHALGRKLSAKQTDEVPLRWLRAFIVAEARGVAFGEDLIRHGFAVPPSPLGQCRQLKENRFQKASPLGKLDGRRPD